MKTYVVLNDIQFPFHDEQVLYHLVLPFIERLRPTGVVLNGDIVDNYTLSEFRKNPMEKRDLATEIALAEDLMRRLVAVTTPGHRWWLGGNHEQRLQKYVWGHAPALGVIGSVEFPNLFHLADYGFQWKPYGQGVWLGKLYVTHGTEVCRHSAWTAKAHWLKHGTSVLIGHTHRLGQYHLTNTMGDHAAYENGCLCRLDPEYDPAPNWQHGFAVVHVGDDGYFNVQQVRILERTKFFWGSELIELTPQRTRKTSHTEKTTWAKRRSR
jgi:predicted phosphodiesterase